LKEVESFRARRRGREKEGRGGERSLIFGSNQ